MREDGREQSLAVVVAYGVRADGVREVLGLDVINSEDVESWRGFLQGLVARGAHGVKLAIKEVLVGAGWQRCRVHFLRNLLARVPKTAMVAATILQIFQQADRAAAQAQLRQVCELLRARFPKAVEVLEAAEEEVLAFYDFPAEHWRHIKQHQPAGATQQGTQAPQRGHGDPAQPGGGPALVGGATGPAARRVARPTALLQRGVNAQARGAGRRDGDGRVRGSDRHLTGRYRRMTPKPSLRR